MKQFVKVEATPFSGNDIKNPISTQPSKQFHINVSAIKTVRHNTIHTFEVPFTFGGEQFKNLRFVNQKDFQELGLE